MDSPGGCSSRLWFAAALLADGWSERVRIELASGRITRIQTQASPQEGDERHGIAVPGIPNVHSHAFQRAMAGLAEVRDADGSSFWTWRELMYRLVDRLDPDDLEAITAQAYLEMLESGFTRVGEFHYLHHASDGSPYRDLAEHAARIAAAAHETGIGLTLLPVFYAHGGFGAPTASPSQRRFLNDVDRYARLLDASGRVLKGLDQAVVGAAAHSLRAVTPHELEAIVHLSGEGPIHIHVAEQEREVDECIRTLGARPVEWLLDHAEIDARWCLVHATHMTESEVGRLAGSGAVVGLCPVTEANLGDGLFAAEQYCEAGGMWGIGSDSNVSIDPAEELRLLEYGQRIARRSRNVLALSPGRSTGRTLFDAACAGGARALGTDSVALMPGAAADIVSLRADHESLQARTGDAWLDTWIFAPRSRLIDCVWRGGRKVVAAGRHVARERIVKRYMKTLKRVLE